MSTELKERESSAHEDMQPGWYKPSADDSLEKDYFAPSATDADLPDNHPSKKDSSSSASSATTDTKGGLRAKLKGKKKGIVGILAGVLMGGVFAFFGFLAGPLELMHLGNILGNASRPTSSLLRTRTGHFFRNQRAVATGQVGETRVGRIGSKIFAKAEGQLNRSGITIERGSGSTGRPTNMKINPANNPLFKDLAPDQTRGAIARHFNIEPSRLSVTGSTYNISMTDSNIRQTRALTFSALASLEDGRVKTAMNKRIMAKYFNVPSLFRPFKRLQAGAENRYATRAQRRDAERERKQNKRPRFGLKYTKKIDDTKKKYATSKYTNFLFIATGAYCFAKEISVLIPYLNFAAIVVPSALGAVDKEAINSQIIHGDELEYGQAGGTQETFKNEDGISLWPAAGLKALANSGRDMGGEELPQGYRQAFSQESTAGNINGALSSFGGSIGCSKGFLAIQAIAGLALAFVPGAGWGIRVGTSLAGAALSMKVMSYVTEILLDRITEDPVEFFSGPLGGNLLAYGAMAGNNINARSMGGIELTPEQSSELRTVALQDEQEAFQRKSFFARTFDIHDHRTLAAQSVLMFSGSFKQNITQFIAKISNPFKMFSSVASALTSSVSAQNEEEFDWEFPLYAVPLDIINDPKYNDHERNAEHISHLFDRYEEELALLGTEDEEEAALDFIAYMEELKRRARECWGVEIKRDSERMWYAKRVQETNPTEEEYESGRCDDLKREEGEQEDEDWIRLMVFVLDNSIMSGFDCFDEGGRESCADMGMGTAQVGDTATTGGGDGQVIGDPNSPSDNIDCPEGTKDLGTETPAYSGGSEIPTRLCEIVEWKNTGASGAPNYVPGSEGGVISNSRVAGAWLALYNKAQSEGVELPVNSAFRTMAHQQRLCNNNARCRSGIYDEVARPGTSNHQTGHAVDFSNVGGKKLGATCDNRNMQTGSPVWVWLENNARDFGFKVYSVEPWHWDAGSGGKMC